MINERTYPLDRPLPSDVAAGEAALIQFYQKYAVFSWPWAWRRTVVFGAFAVASGMLFGLSHGLFVKSVLETLTVGLVKSVGHLVTLGAGPMLGALVRNTRWPRGLQSVLIVAAVLCGIALGWFAETATDAFHDWRMVQHGSHLPPPPSRPIGFHALVSRGLDIARDLFLLFVTSGGLALASYFTEPRRWAEHRRRVELERLSAEKSEADMRLTVLQAQVEPHFLFNTLASVRSLIHSDRQRAAQMIDALAQHLRATLPKLRAETGLAQSTLGEQFAICSSYLELMRIRLGERLRIEVRLPDELREVPFPPLLLLSLVENAIKHGVEPKPGATHVTLAARRIEAGKLEVYVEDDGAGLKLGMGEGTGLANIRAQLRTRFGANASLELWERNAGGVFARLVLPAEAP